MALAPLVASGTEESRKSFLDSLKDVYFPGIKIRGKAGLDQIDERLEEILNQSYTMERSSSGFRVSINTDQP